MVHILQNACKNDKYNEKKYDGKNRPFQVTLSINILLIDIRESAMWIKNPKWNSLEMDLKTVAGIELIWLHIGWILFAFIITYKWFGRYHGRYFRGTISPRSNFFKNQRKLEYNSRFRVQFLVLILLGRWSFQSVQRFTDLYEDCALGQQSAKSPHR